MSWAFVVCARMETNQNRCHGTSFAETRASGNHPINNKIHDNHRSGNNSLISDSHQLHTQKIIELTSIAQRQHIETADIFSEKQQAVGSQKRCLWAPRQIKDLDIFFENTACFLSQKRCPQPRKFSEKLSFGMSRPCLGASTELGDRQRNGGTF